jgi:hypothetical protein
MDYIKKFKNHSEYEVVKIDLPDPNVSYCANQADVHYKRHDYLKDYLTIESLEYNNTIYFYTNDSGNTKTISAS